LHTTVHDGNDNSQAKVSKFALYVHCMTRAARRHLRLTATRRTNTWQVLQEGQQKQHQLRFNLKHK